ncbi:MAG: 6,7-dimethyl-8-ribityllumazine synthase [Terriglobales bacterium]
MLVLRKIRKKARRHFWRSVRRSSRASKSDADWCGSKPISPRRLGVTEKNHKSDPSLGAPPPPREVKALGGNLNAARKRFGIVVSRFNEFITERLLRSAFDGLLRCGAKSKDIQVIRVPGSFEIPSAARTLAETKKYDAIICLGCLLRGDTAHYDVIVNEVARGIGQSAQETGVPHAFGVLTCETLEQAIDRAGLKMGNKGFEAALAAVEMANLKQTVAGRSSLAVGKKVVSSQPSAVSKKRKPRQSARPKERSR